jgi:nucleotide-binding universal stress UspA family protein
MSSVPDSVPPGPVVVGVDGSTSGEDALALARCASRILDARLLVAVVHPAPAPISPARVDAEWVADRHRLAERILDRARQLLADAQAPVEYQIVAADSAARGLLDIAEEVRASVLVIGSRARVAGERPFGGRTVERLLSGTPCPVAAAPAGSREREPGQLRRIGVAYVDAPDAAVALELAARLALRTSAVLRLYSVIPEEAEVLPPFVGRDVERAFTLTTRELAQRDLEAAIAALPPGVEAEGVILAGDVVEALAVLGPDELDVLCCGSRGYGPARRALLGGVSAPLLRLARSPVVVVPRR